MGLFRKCVECGNKLACVTEDEPAEIIREDCFPCGKITDFKIISE